MKIQPPKHLIANGMFIATTIAILCFIIGFIGGLVSYEPKALFIIMSICGLTLSIASIATMPHYLPQVGGRKAINKAIKTISFVLIVLASIILFCALVSQITLATCDAVYNFHHK